MKRALIALAVVAFIAAGAAQPAMTQENDSDTEVPEELENETEEAENDSAEEIDEADGESAQFDARLKVATDTVRALIEIAPNDQAEQGLQNALEELERVQNNTDTASLGPEERPEGPETPEESETESEEETENETEQESSERRGPPEDRGPSGTPGGENSNRPGFVSGMLGGIFG